MTLLDRPHILRLAYKALRRGNDHAASRWLKLAHSGSRLAAGPPKPPRPRRLPAEIEAERQRLTAQVEALIERIEHGIDDENARLAEQEDFDSPLDEPCA